jgi:type I restriction enzyme S subunit
MKQQTKFKQTEIGEIPEDWEIKTIGESIEINSKREIKKGTKVKFVAMQDLEEFNKKIKSFSHRSFKGGSKFKNGDTLMARITPCLENGKTAFVDILEENEVGAGSTEFIVLSGKKGETINQFVYYLTVSSQMRADAIQSMTGTSGRQRVQNDLLSSKRIIIPPINEQKSIASILSSLDSKIELNQKMNKTLEAIGQALFKRWFVDFEFPNEKGKPYKSSGGEMIDSELGKIPKGWKVGKLKDLVGNVKDSLQAGEGIKNRKYVPIDNLSMNQIGLTSYLPYTEAQSSLIGFEKDDILIGAMRIYFHRVNLAPFSGVTRTTSFVLRPKNKNQLSYSLFLLNLDETIGFANAHSKGSTMPYAVWNNSLENMPVIIPNNEIMKSFNDLIYPQLCSIRDMVFESNNLSVIRDSLLPKLMSGEIRVSLEKER